MRDRLELTDEEMNPAYTHLTNSWLKKVFRRHERIPLRTAAKIHRTARAVDPQLNTRLIRQILNGWTRAFSH